VLHSGLTTLIATPIEAHGRRRVVVSLTDNRDPMVANHLLEHLKVWVVKVLTQEVHHMSRPSG